MQAGPWDWSISMTPACCRSDEVLPYPAPQGATAGSSFSQLHRGDRKLCRSWGHHGGSGSATFSKSESSNGTSQVA